MAEELIYKVGVEGTKELDRLDKATKKVGQTTNKTTSYMSELRREQRAMRGEMIKNAQGTEAYNRALRRGAEITGQIADANSKMNMGIMDLGQTTRNVTSAVTGFAGGFQVVQASMQLFGIENEEAIKSIMRLQQTMAIIQGMAAFAQGIGDVQDLVANFRAESNLAKQSVGELGNAQDLASDSASNLGKESAVLSSNLTGNQAIADKVADSTSKNKEQYDKLVASIKEITLASEKETLTLQEQINKKETLAGMKESDLKMDIKAGKLTQKGIENRQKEIDGLYEELNALRSKKDIEENLAKTKVKGLEKQKEVIKVTSEATKETEKLSESTEDSGKKTKGAAEAQGGFIKSIGKSLLTMGAFLAVIWVATAAISALIKHINEVPESVKVDIEINENVQRDLAKTRLEVRKFVSDYKRAWRNADEDRIKSLQKIAREEYELSDERLKLITDTEDGWETAFENYLKIAEKTYRAESIMKRRIDTETDMALAQSKAESLFKGSTGRDDLSGKAGGFWEGKLSWEELQKRAKQKGWLAKNMNNLFTMGVPQQILDELRKVAVAQEVLDNLPEIDYSGVDFGTGEVKTTGGGKGTPKESVDPLARKKPDKVEDDLEIEFLRKRLLAKEELTNEELVMLEEYQRLSNKQADNSYIKYTEHQIRMAKAREKDLANTEQSLINELEAKKDKYNEDLKLYNEELASQTDSHNFELEQLKVYNAEKLRIEEEFKQMSKDGAKDADLEPLRKEYETVTNHIENSKNKIADYKKEISKIQTALNQTDLLPEEIKALEEQLDQLNLKIAENGNFLADSLNENMRAMLDTATVYMDQIGQAFQGMNNLTQGFMDAEDNRLAKEKNRLELSQQYREADAEQQAQMMYELEMENYENKKKTFEWNKNFEMGAVVATSASNQMDIIANLLDPKNGGYLNPVNIATAAAATVANLATTVGSIAQIKSTTLDEPIPPGMGSGSGLGGMQVALNPHKSSLTSKEENLNMMHKSNKDAPKDNVVKVSDINKVQNNVKVREKNSSY